MAQYEAVGTIIRAGSKKDAKGNPIMETIAPGTIIAVTGDEEAELKAAGAIRPEKARKDGGARLVAPSSASATIPKDRTTTAKTADASGADTSKLIDNTSDPAKGAQAGIVAQSSVAGDAEKAAASGAATTTDTTTAQTSSTASADRTTAAKAPAKGRAGRPKKSDSDVIG